MDQHSIINKTAAALVAELKARFDEAKTNLKGHRPVSTAAKGLLDGSLNVAAEVSRMTGVTMDMSRPVGRLPILLVASKFGTWASEVTLVAAVLVKAGYRIRFASEDGSPPHFLSPSMTTSFLDGAWRTSVVSEEERELALRFLKPGTEENRLFDNILDLRSLARPPQVGDYLNDTESLSRYSDELLKTMELAVEYEALCIAGGSGAIPGLMFDRGLHSLILAFHKLGKPIMGECNGGLALVQTLDPSTGHSILAGRAVTTHSLLDEYQAGWGWTQPFLADTALFWKQDGKFDIDSYGGAETWYQPGLGGNPLIDSESAFRNAIGLGGVFFSPAGSPYSVVVDGHFVTCRSTPDGYPGALCLMAVLDGKEPLKGRFFIHADQLGSRNP